MSGVIKRLFLVVIKGRFKTILYGPFTAKTRADELVERQKASSEVLDAFVDEMPVNEDAPESLMAWLRERYPNT